jgi:hypothetical protein
MKLIVATSSSDNSSADNILATVDFISLSEEPVIFGVPDFGVQINDDSSITVFY